LGAHRHPEVSMHTPPLAEYVTHIDRGDWAAVGEILLTSANKLATSGADFLICPDNTIHQALPYIENRLPLPLLHIVDVVAEEAKTRSFQRLALTGTQSLVDSDLYPERLSAYGLTVVRPAHEERREIDRIIMQELVYGVFKPDAVLYFQRVIERMKNEGCDAVILGCTEIPLILDDSNSPLPTLDSTRLLARAALNCAAGKTPVRNDRR
jgi:aspartate racemase